MPVDVEVDSDVIALLAEDNPKKADVDNDATLLLVVLSPVDSEPMPVDVEVDSDGRQISDLHG
ncbi:tash protein pest motif family [Burkholderia pseudomallei]|nr:tash protein pest motif family [Burkholderia pseudomallei]